MTIAGVAIFLAAPARAGAGTSACADGLLGNRLVAVSGARFTDLADRTASQVRAWAWHGGKRRPVPFQLDECGEDGRVVVGTRERPAPPARLGPRALVLLRSEDAGEPPPPSFRSEGVFAVELLDAAESRRWLYLGPDDGTMELSTVDEVDYDPGHDRIEAERFTLGFERPQINYFSVADGKGHDRGNILDRLKARVAAHVLWGLVSFRRNEDQVSEVVLGYRDGPLRAVRRARLEVEIGWGMPSPLIIADDYFYADHAEGPISITIPFALAYLFGDLDVKIFLDFRDLDGFELLSEGLAGRTIRVGEEGVPAAARTTWFLLRKGGTAFLHRLRLGAGLESVEPTLYYVYDAAADDPPESVRGERPAVGYRLKGWRTVPRGRYEIWMDTYLLDGAAARDPEAAIAALSRPLRVAVERAAR